MTHSEARILTRTIRATAAWTNARMRLTDQGTWTVLLDHPSTHMTELMQLEYGLHYLVTYILDAPERL